MIREIAYDEVFDAQRHFRSILDSLSRPGKINTLSAVQLTPPAGLNQASALVAFALLNADVSFHLVGMGEAEAAHLAANTRADAVPLEEATFIFAAGGASPAILEDANCGTLAYPDTSATMVLQVEVLSRVPIPGGLKLSFTGPGVDGSATACARHLNPDLLLALQARNAEFPLGIDVLLTCDGSGDPQVVGVPRTATLSWEAC